MNNQSGGRAVQRVDGYYLYQVGSQIHPLSELKAYAFGPGGGPTTHGEASVLIYIAAAALEPLLSRSVFRLRTSAQSGYTLLNAIRDLRAKIERLNTPDAKLDWSDVYPITTALTTFEAVLGAELALMPLYVVMPKSGFDTTVLIESGARCFPDDVAAKCPEALPDLAQATRCVAFELFTSAGFHLHRANEAVLHKYWDAVSNGAPRPASRNMGDYIKAMNDKNIGDPKVKAALKDLKDLHRNPLIHPEHSLESADEAIALMNGVHTVMVYMLKEIAVTSAVPVPVPPGGVVPPAPISNQPAS